MMAPCSRIASKGAGFDCNAFQAAPRSFLAGLLQIVYRLFLYTGSAGLDPLMSHKHMVLVCKVQYLRHKDRVPFTNHNDRDGAVAVYEVKAVAAVGACLKRPVHPQSSHSSGRPLGSSSSVVDDTSTRQRLV